MHLHDQSPAAQLEVRSASRRGLTTAVIGAVSLTIVGCAQMMNGLNRFINPDAQANPEASMTPAIVAATPAAMPTVSPADLPATTARSRASVRAKAKTSRPSVAAAKPPSSASSETVVDSPEATTPPVITLADPADPSTHVPNGPPASPAAASSLAMAAPDGALRNKTEQMIREVNAQANQIDQKSLTPDQVSSETSATRLIRSAEKSFDDQDYSAAHSLATKASALLRSLPKVDSAQSSSHR